VKAVDPLARTRQDRKLLDASLDGDGLHQQDFSVERFEDAELPSFPQPVAGSLRSPKAYALGCPLN
jgi:hypothetical protein